MKRHSEYRQRIRDIIENAVGPLSAEDVRTALSDLGIGIATVYRHLKVGVGNNEFVCVELPNGPKRFELADRPYHHHFECVSCQKVFDIEGSPGDFDRLVPEGFKMEHHNVILSGLCNDCVSPDGQAV